MGHEKGRGRGKRGQDSNDHPQNTIVQSQLTEET